MLWLFWYIINKQLSFLCREGNSWILNCASLSFFSFNFTSSNYFRRHMYGTAMHHAWSLGTTWWYCLLSSSNKSLSCRPFFFFFSPVKKSLSVLLKHRFTVWHCSFRLSLYEATCVLDPHRNPFLLLSFWISDFLFFHWWPEVDWAEDSTTLDVRSFEANTVYKQRWEYTMIKWVLRRQGAFQSAEPFHCMKLRSDSSFHLTISKYLL